MEEIEFYIGRVEDLEEEVNKLKEENETLNSFVETVKDGLRWL